MDIKTLSTVAVGLTFVALDANSTSAAPKPADPFHWSTSIRASVEPTSRTVRYNRKAYVVPDNLSAEPFIRECLNDNDSVLRVRGFLNRQGKPEWSKAEFLCTKSVGGPELPPEFAQLPTQEVKVFGKGPTTLRSCEPRSKNKRRIWTECGVVVPNDGTSAVLIGNGQNAGRVMKTAKTGSGVNTVEPVLVPEVETMREKIFRDRLQSGYYSRSV